MSTYKRGDSKSWWYAFMFRGERVQESTQQKNREVARGMEARHRARLADEHKERESRAEKLGCVPEALVACSDCGLLFNGGAGPITDGKNIFCSSLCQEKWRSRQSPVPTWSEFSGGRFMEQMEEKTRNGILSTLTPLGEFGARILVPGGVGLFKVDFSRDNSCHAENYSPSRSGSFSMPPRAMNAGWFATTP